MKKFNTDNIMAGLKQVEQLAGQIDTAYDAVIDAEYIHPAKENRYADNDTDEDIQALADDIAVNGLLNAVVLRKVSDTDYRIISGERRFRAVTTKLNWKQIRCRVHENLSEDKAQLMLHTANLQAREYSAAQKLSFYEDCHRLLSKMKESGEYRGGIQEGIAKMLSVSDRQVRTYKTIAENTTPEERREISEGNISLKAAYEKANKKKSGSASALQEAEATDTIDPKWIKEALCQKLHCDNVIRFYSLEVPTPAESVNYLKKNYRNSGGTVIYSDGSSDFCNWSSDLELRHHSFKIINYSYSEVDTIIRKMIRNFELLPIVEHKKVLSSYLTQKMLAELDKVEPNCKGESA